MRKHAMEALFPATRRDILGLLFRQPDDWWFLSELSSAIGTAPSSLQRELASLRESGIVLRRTEGRRTYYKANREAAIFPELQSLVEKTLGIPPLLNEALRPLAGRIGTAIIYGSVARGDARSDSDVDLLLVSDDVTMEDLFVQLEPVERRLRRRIHPTIYSTDEFRRRREDGNPFLEEVLNGPKISLLE